MKCISQKKFFKTSLVTLSLMVFLITSAIAGNDGQELVSVYDKLTGIIGGIGGKIIAFFSGVMGLIGCTVKFNPVAIMSFFGVAIGIGSLSAIVESTVTCLLTF